MSLVDDLTAELIRLEHQLQQSEYQLEQVKQELIQSKRHTYVGQTHGLHASDGELTIEYGDNQFVVMAADQLFQDLPGIVNLCLTEQSKMQEETLQRIKNELGEL